MVTLQGEKKRWNGTKPWCLTDLVSSFNPCAPCSLDSLYVFPCFSLFLQWHKIGSDDPLWNEQIGFYMACSVSTRLAGRFARHGELSFLPQWVSATSALRGQTALTRLPSKYTRHGELSSPCTRHGAWEVSNYAFLPLLAFATHHCELEASNFNFLPQLAFELAVASWPLHFFMFCF